MANNGVGLPSTPTAQNNHGINNGYVYKRSDFPPLSTAGSDKMSELSSAVQKMQTCLDYLMNQAKLNASHQHTNGNQHLPFNAQQPLRNSTQFNHELSNIVSKN